MTNDPLRIYAPPRPAMQGRYLIRNRRMAQAIGALDRLLGLFFRRASAPMPGLPRRILVSNWAHLGDIVLALPALAVLRRTYPNAKIGFLTGSWNRALVTQTGLIDHLHLVDHWQISRRDETKSAKFSRYFKMRRTAVPEIRALGYDVAIDLYPYFPPASPLFRAAGIPTRIGFTSGGFGPLLTHPVEWRDEPRHMIDYHRDLLNLLSRPAPLQSGDLFAVYPGQPSAPLPEQLAELRVGYLILHMGSGDPAKEWPKDRWIEVVDALTDAGHVVALTGIGRREADMIAEIHARFPAQTIPLVDLPWNDIVAAVAGARAILCVDTVIAHVAACFIRPTVVLFSGVNTPAQWRPLNPQGRILTAPTGCAPCHRKGCDAMACLRDVTPTDVLESLVEFGIVDSVARNL